MGNTSKDHAKEINRVIDYIYDNLDKSLTLDELSAHFNLSPYHFHRIFSAVAGEALGKYVQRVRIQQAAAVLLRDPDYPILDVACECGYNSVSVFCRHFKKYYGMTATDYRHKNQQQESKNDQQNSINDPSSRSYSSYFCADKKIQLGGKIMKCTFEMKNLPELEIIYYRHQGAYDKMEAAFGKLLQWAYPRGLVAPGMKLLSVYHDDPAVTDKSKLISDAGMIVTKEIKADGEVGRKTLTGGLYAIGRFEIAMDEFEDAWNTMFGLLVEHGCVCTYGDHYEVYQNNRDEHPEKKFIVDICIPVKAK